MAKPIKKGPLLLAGAALLLAGPLLAPSVLAFPYRAQVGTFDIRSEAPLPTAEIERVIADANRRIATSPIADPQGEKRSIYLTQGGWRWNWLAMQSRKSFALTRAMTDYVLVNRSDLAANQMANRGALGATRTLSSIIAHETCHGMERRRYGRFMSVTHPTWLVEGYCDYVAQESTLDDARVAQLKARGERHPAMIYYEGRKRVEAELARNGGNVDKLFAEAK
ncbi:hypothetical protein OKA06_07765 [Novosphingobium sp. MW5]|nr:hypothetical protein [Novosphingobium sp. MW5]